MKKIIIRYGLIVGFIIIGSMLWGITLSDGQGGFSAAIGYLIMIVAMTMIFIGVKRYRDQELGGVIKFGRAFMLGLGITLIASTIYVATWEVYLALTDHAFINDYAAGIISRRQDGGISDEDMAALVAQMDNIKAQYANPFYRLPMTFAEIFPVGLIVSLISAAVLRFSHILPARN